MNKITSIEQKVDKNQNPMKVVTFEGADKVVYVNKKYDSNYDSVVVGAEFELEVDGNFLKIKSDKPKKSGSTYMEDRKQDGIKIAQDNKQDGIKIASTFRDATLITNHFVDNGVDLHDVYKANWNKWRAWLWEQYDKPLDRKWLEDNTQAF